MEELLEFTDRVSDFRNACQTGNQGCNSDPIIVAFWGISPVMVTRSSHHIQPLIFAANSTLLAAADAFIYTELNCKLSELRKTNQLIFSVRTLLVNIIEESKHSDVWNSLIERDLIPNENTG